jgi:hypothetical protein
MAILRSTSTDQGHKRQDHGSPGSQYQNDSATGHADTSSPHALNKDITRICANDWLIGQTLSLTK